MKQQGKIMLGRKRVGGYWRTGDNKFDFVIYGIRHHECTEDEFINYMNFCYADNWSVTETKCEYEIQGNYGYGWDLLTTENTKEEAVEMLRCYNENEQGVPHRIRKVVYDESIRISEESEQ